MYLEADDPSGRKKLASSEKDTDIDRNSHANI